MRVSLVRTRVCGRRWALTEPERGIGLYLNPNDCTAGYALLNPSDRWLLTEPDGAIPSLLLLTEANRLDEQ